VWCACQWYALEPTTGLPCRRCCRRLACGLGQRLSAQPGAAAVGLAKASHALERIVRLSWPSSVDYHVGTAGGGHLASATLLSGELLRFPSSLALLWISCLVFRSILVFYWNDYSLIPTEQTWIMHKIFVSAFNNPYYLLRCNSAYEHHLSYWWSKHRVDDSYYSWLMYMPVPYCCCCRDALSIYACKHIF
jgi:hypothetical protein